MTDLEILQRAKRYIDDLANGTDPISGTELPEDTALNNVRLARCFFYVSGVLQRVIDNGGEVGGLPKKEKKLPFSITRQEIETVRLSDEPVFISHFCKTISAAANAEEKNMRNLPHRLITGWLLEKGILEETEINGRKRKRVTGLGAGLGLSEVEREAREGRYFAITYNKEAQQFILDNLETILESKEG